MKSTKPKFEPILTAHVGKNADVFPLIFELYVPMNATVADVTWGTGAFWRNFTALTETWLHLKGVEEESVMIRWMQWKDRKYRVHASDLNTGVDLRELPYADESHDVVILDPPYAHSSEAPMKESISRGYNLNSITGGRKQVMNLYYEGMCEAQRILKHKGILIVKCQNEIESGKQRWNRNRIQQEAEDLGFYTKDEFVLVQPNTPTMRHQYQLHARKNHSFFLVFVKKWEPKAVVL
jgi:tRNA G10  N-methylase Trm11